MPEHEQKPAGPHQAPLFLRLQLRERAQRSMAALAALVGNARQHPPAHPFLLGSAEQCLNSLEELFSGQEQAAFRVQAGECFLDDIALPPDEKLLIFVDDWSAMGIGGITFSTGLKRDELVAFAYLFGNRPPAAVLRQMLEKAKVSHIAVHGQEEDRREDQEKRTVTDTKAVFGPYQECLRAAREMMQAARAGKALDADRLDTAGRKLAAGVQHDRDGFLALTSLPLPEEYAFVHPVNVAVLCAALGSFSGCDQSCREELAVAGLMHDIGKALTPLDILFKEELTEAEKSVLWQHSLDGALLLSGFDKHPSAMTAALEHHEPYGRAGNQGTGEAEGLHPVSRITAIADAYESLTALRIYYGIPLEPQNVVSVLLSTIGTQYDPVLLKAFLNMVGIFPAGTLLKLDTGETGLVIRQTADLVRPRVRLLTLPGGAAGEEVSILERAGGRYTRTPVATLDPDVVAINVRSYFMLD